MRLTIFLLFLAVVTFSQEKANTTCKALYYESIATWAGGRWVVIVGNDCQKCKIEGPDYCPMIIFDAKGDTVASSVINGIPQYKEKRHYDIFLNPRYPKKEMYDNLRISLIPYCDNLKKMSVK